MEDPSINILHTLLLDPSDEKAANSLFSIWKRKGLKLGMTLYVVQDSSDFGTNPFWYGFDKKESRSKFKECIERKYFPILGASVDIDEKCYEVGYFRSYSFSVAILSLEI